MEMMLDVLDAVCEMKTCCIGNSSMKWKVR